MGAFHTAVASRIRGTLIVCSGAIGSDLPIGPTASLTEAKTRLVEFPQQARLDELRSTVLFDPADEGCPRGKAKETTRWVLRRNPR